MREMIKAKLEERRALLKVLVGEIQKLEIVINEKRNMALRLDGAVRELEHILGLDKVASPQPPSPLPNPPTKVTKKKSRMKIVRKK